MEMREAFDPSSRYNPHLRLHYDIRMIPHQEWPLLYLTIHTTHLRTHVLNAITPKPLSKIGRILIPYVDMCLTNTIQTQATRIQHHGKHIYCIDFFSVPFDLHVCIARLQTI